MKLDKNRKFEYTKIKVEDNHPKADYYKVRYKAQDDSEIYVELLIPKDKVVGVFLELPDYKSFPKDYLNLGRYCILNYAVASLHIRGQAGKSENRQPASIYFPYLNNQDNELYYNFVYQDVIDLVKILREEFPKLPINILGVGQGAALGIVASAITREIDKLFISNASNCGFDIIFNDNGDTGVYESIRDYNRNYPEKEQIMLEKLAKIDILKYAPEVNAEVYYGYSHLNVRTPKKCQDKLLELLKDKEVVNYRKFEHEVLQEHFFDEFVLKKLGMENN
ncbi:acetylxylan esterase [Gemella cuniculi]|uniref:acetylxylan esterase n=1 Tax=Gemella cuniculi TaxID=150240 RepID=UPI0004223435|nr:acetylxylan esterase [Gemella cuniculi]